MKPSNRLVIFLFVIFIIFGVYYTVRLRDKNETAKPNTSVSSVTLEVNQQLPTVGSSEINSNKPDVPLVSIVAEGLDTPWAISFLPDGDLLVTERKGTIRLIRKDNSQPEIVATINSVKEISEGGLQGITLHPDFEKNRFVYVYYTYSGGENGTLNRVSRFNFDGKSFTNEVFIVDAIPGAPNHNGGRIKFGPDKKLYITTGDAQNPSNAQDKNSLAGKILRVNDDGTPAPGNPFGNRTYSFGHRNPQGITWDRNGTLWSTEHGPSGTQTGNDEFNKIEVGKNYGWPDIKGKETKDGMVTPIIESGFLNAWAPAALVYLSSDSEGKFFFAGLRGSALYELDENGKNLKTHFKNKFGRLREVAVGPDNMLYVTTSNQDGRGNPKAGDDKILRLNPDIL